MEYNTRIRQINAENVLRRTKIVMKKSEFITAVAKESGITRVEAEKVVNTALSIISSTLKSGDKVTLTGFGTFEVRQRAARVGMNIRTKQRMEIPPSKRPVFSAGAVLRESVVGKKKVKAGSNGKGGKAKPAAKASTIAVTMKNFLCITKLLLQSERQHGAAISVNPECRAWKL